MRAQDDRNTSRGKKHTYSARAWGYATCQQPKQPYSDRLPRQGGRTALHVASSHGRADCVKALTDAGADKGAKDNVRNNERAWLLVCPCVAEPATSDHIRCGRSIFF